MNEHIQEIAEKINHLIESKANEMQASSESDYTKLEDLVEYIKAQREQCAEMLQTTKDKCYSAENLMAEGGIIWLDVILEFVDQM